MADTSMTQSSPGLETARLILRPLDLQDRDFIFQHFSHPDVGRYLLDDVPVITPEQAEEIINFYLDPAAQLYNRWVITMKDDGKPIGTIGFHKWSRISHRAEVGFDLTPGYWGKGLMTEALSEVVRYGFMMMGLNRIEALIYVENERSLRLVERLGFQQEGKLRDYFYQEGKYYDHYLYALLRQEWESGE